MAYIKVDHSELTSSAVVVEKYITFLKSKMNSAQGEVDTLSATWQGADFTEFNAQWDKVTDNNSTYMQMLKSLESYQRFLEHASNKYKEVQSKAVNRADALPKY